MKNFFSKKPALASVVVSAVAVMMLAGCTNSASDNAVQKTGSAAGAPPEQLKPGSQTGPASDAPRDSDRTGTTSGVTTESAQDLKQNGPDYGHTHPSPAKTTRTEPK